MKGPYMEQHEMQQLEALLSHSLRDTLSCWKATRLRGVSASLACDGNVCIPLIKAFDELAAETQPLRQQLDLIKADLMIANEAAKESWDQAKALEQQLAECEQQRDSNYDEMQRAWAELKESIRERNAFQDQCISLKMKMTVMREERDELVAALKKISGCVATVGWCIYVASSALAKLGADKMGEV